MAEVTKLKTFKNVVPITTWVTYVKASTEDELVVPEYGVSDAVLTTNGQPEGWMFKEVSIASAITSQDKGVIKFGGADATLFANGGYVWNITQDEVVLIRSVGEDGSVSMSRGLFGTPVTTWAQNDECLLLRVLVLASANTGKGIGKYCPMPDIGIGQDLIEV